VADAQPLSVRAQVVDRLADLVNSLHRGRPLRVAIDGPDAAGKTFLADEISEALADRGRPTIRASIDGFHRPRVERYRRGPDSPEGYYEDSFDYPALRRVLLDPLGPGGSRAYQTRAFDYRTDMPEHVQVLQASDEDVLLFDGVFLLRPELADVWDYRIFVSASFEETLRRARVRDSPLLGSADEVERRYRRRYIPGQKRYFAVARPTDIADVIVENTDPTRPRLRT
jgi:uridine kinase